MDDVVPDRTLSHLFAFFGSVDHCNPANNVVVPRRGLEVKLPFTFTFVSPVIRMAALR